MIHDVDKQNAILMKMAMTSVICTKWLIIINNGRNIMYVKKA